MDAHELMIGNWVLDKKGIPKQVHCISKYSVVLYTTLWIERNYSDLSPIPLTPEILGKFGFEKEVPCAYCVLHITDGIRASSNRYPGQISIECKDGYDWLDRFDLKYLHQLQNLYYALTGKQLIFNP